VVVTEAAAAVVVMDGVEAVEAVQAGTPDSEALVTVMTTPLRRTLGESHSRAPSSNLPRNGAQVSGLVWQVVPLEDMQRAEWAKIATTTVTIGTMMSLCKIVAAAPHHTRHHRQPDHRE
jgi:hypothetical protein